MNRRDEILERLRLVEKAQFRVTNEKGEYDEVLLELAKKGYAALKEERQELLRAYVECLQHVPVSRCPHCGSLLQVAIDLGGLDGPWWWKLRSFDLPPHQACEHYLVFLGAMDLHGRTPKEADDEVLLGPSIPYVVARLLEMETMVAVISSLEDAKGDTIYLISYFTERDVPQGQRHQEWRHQTYPLYDDNGNYVASSAKFDPWDFRLEPWLEKGKLLWIAPKDGEMKLRRGLPCPYVGLQGVKKNQAAAGGELRLLAPPRGEEYAAYERDWP